MLKQISKSDWKNHLKKHSIVLKYIRPGKKEHGYTKVFIHDKYVGYFMPNRSRHATVGENYNFVSKVEGIVSFYESNRRNIIEKLISLLNYQELRDLQMDDPTETWKCIKCGYEIFDNEGECGINGIIEEGDDTYADDPCPECGGRLLKVKE